MTREITKDGILYKFRSAIDAAYWVGNNLPEKEHEAVMKQILSNRRKSGEYKWLCNEKVEQTALN